MNRPHFSFSMRFQVKTTNSLSAIQWIIILRKITCEWFFKKNCHEKNFVKMLKLLIGISKLRSQRNNKPWSIDSFQWCRTLLGRLFERDWGNSTYVCMYTSQIKPHTEVTTKACKYLNRDKVLDIILQPYK